MDISTMNNCGMLIDGFAYTGLVVVGVCPEDGSKIGLWSGEFHGDTVERANEVIASAQSVDIGGKTYLPRYFHFFDKEGKSRYIFR